MTSALDAHAKPPAVIRDTYKRYQKIHASALIDQADLIKFEGNTGEPGDKLSQKSLTILPTDLRLIFSDFLHLGQDVKEPSSHDLVTEQGPSAFEVLGLPGLFIYPSLLPQSVQLSLLNKLLHRDLANPQHQTNIHMHYQIPYPPAGASFFDPTASSLTFHPKDPEIHKPLTTPTFLNKKLRWTTLGGQYDWTQKLYPASPPPAFPTDVKILVENIFPMKVEAAIVNLYSPGDTLSLHRDVSEECNQPLVSISLGCEAVFVVGLEGEDADGNPRVATILLRSGDALLMSGESRYAWHGVPKVLEKTCPEWMQGWPYSDGEGEKYEQWKGWMRGKRVNLNVRQMFD